MAEIGEIINSVGPAGQTVVYTTIWVLIALLSVVALGLLIWWAFMRKKYNLRVEIKLPRSDGNIINGEWGKGSYDASRGVVLIKRPGRGSKPIPMKIFDVKRYLQGENLLTVIQLGAEDFRPVLNRSYTTHEVEYVDETKPKKDKNGNAIVDKDGKPVFETTIVKESIMNIKTETGKNKAWKAAFDEAAKTAYTIQSLFRQYQTPIAVGIVVLCCFIGFAVLWTKLSSICG